MPPTLKVIFSVTLVALSILGSRLPVDSVIIFLISGTAIIPLAHTIAESTETISHRSGPVIGGLLNATFGNAPEMIVALIALRSGLIELVKASIAGTIIANLLLALGLAMVTGGIRYREQFFCRKKARINIAPLNLALVVMFAPAAIRMTSAQCDDSVIMGFSLLAACLLLAFYVLTLVFSLKTHRGLYEMSETETANLGNTGAAVTSETRSSSTAVVTLFIASCLLCLVSESLVGSLQLVIKDRGFNELFTGVFLIPLFGGAVEYLVAMRLARSNNMDLSVAIATGSSLQISMFVAPILVLFGWLWDQPMNFDFHHFELLAAGTAVALTNSISNDGTTNWLEGVLLIMVYAVIGIALYFHP